MLRTLLIAVTLFALLGCRANPTAPTAHSPEHLLVATTVTPERGGLEQPTVPSTIKGIEPLTRPLGAPPAPAVLSVTRNGGEVVLQATVADHGSFGAANGWFASATVYLPGGTRAYRISDGERSGVAPVGPAWYWIANIDSDDHLVDTVPEFPNANTVRVTVPGSYIPTGSTVIWGARSIDASGYQHGSPIYELGFRL